jgi:hypothetical protein
VGGGKTNSKRILEKPNIFGCPCLTPLSTNATCQLENMENSGPAGRTRWGSRRTPKKTVSKRRHTRESKYLPNVWVIDGIVQADAVN